MLSHQHRFHGHGSLRYIHSKGTQLRGVKIGLKYIHNKHRVHSRFAVVVSKKIYKSAVKRNRVRRRIYEIIRALLPAIKPSHDIVLSVFDNNILELSHQGLSTTIHETLEKADLFR
jgi:ribonuclease P protein component